MRVCLLSHYPPAQGGIASYARRIADGLRGHGVDLGVVPLNGIADYLRLGSRLRRERPAVARLEVSLSMYGPWVLWLTTVMGRARRRLGLRTAACYHEPVREMRQLGAPARLFYRLVSRAFDRIYVHTEEAREVLRDQAGVPEGKVRVLPLGTYDFPDRNDRAAELESRYSLGDRRVVLFFGYVHVVKGIDHLVRAAGEVYRRRPELRATLQFVVAGGVRRRQGVMRLFERTDHAYHRRLLELRDELGLHDDVRFLGWVDERLVYALISRAEVVVVPYTTAEQSSLLVMAIALGKPTVASALGGHRELLGDVGGLVPVGAVDRYADEILRLVEDPEHYARVVGAYAAIAERDGTPQVTGRLARDLMALAAGQA